MVVRPGGVGIAGNQLAAADVTGQTGTAFFNNRFTVGVEDKLYQAAVFFHLMAQALGVVAVPGLIVCQQVACMVSSSRQSPL